MVEHVVDDLFLGEDSRLAGARVDLDGDALIAAQVRVTPVGRNKGRLQRFEDVLFGRPRASQISLKARINSLFMELVPTYSVFVRNTSAAAFGVKKQKKWGCPLFRRSPPANCSAGSIA
jgi:hypothetical protein